MAVVPVSLPAMRLSLIHIFVEDDDAVGDVVELAAAAAAVGVERLEELHRRRHHNGGVPVFAGQHLAVLGGGQVVLLNSLVLGVGEVGQNIFCAQQRCV